MRYLNSEAFDRSLQELPEAKKKQVKKALRLAAAFFETGDLPHGLGMKPLSHGFWEIRAGLSERIIFQKNDDAIQFLLVGSHDEIRRFLKSV